MQLADCYRNSLELAKTYDIHSIADVYKRQDEW